MPQATLIKETHGVIINEENKTVSASIVPCLDAMETFFKLEDAPSSKHEFMDVVKHRLEETLFSEKTVGQHCQWFIDATKAFLIDCKLPLDFATDNQLHDYATDVITEILKSQNPIANG